MPTNLTDQTAEALSTTAIGQRSPTRWATAVTSFVDSPGAIIPTRNPVHVPGAAIEFLELSGVGAKKLESTEKCS